MSKNFISLNSCVKRLNFSKIDFLNFQPPNLQGIQVKNYNHFVKYQLKKIIEVYFPIYSNSKNTEIHLEDIIIVPPAVDERYCLERAKSYQNSIYLQVKLVTNHNSSNKKKDSKSNVSKVFLGYMPELSTQSNFIINGIEKFVISQIIRSSGAYILHKSQIKLSNSRKKTQEGIICEILPLRGILSLFHFNLNKNIINFVARNSNGDNAPHFSCTIFLKALGLSEENIKNIFPDQMSISNSLESEKYNYKNIIYNDEFKNILNDVISYKNTEKLLELNKNTIKYSMYKLFIEYNDLIGEEVNETLKKLQQFPSTSSPENIKFSNNLNNLIEKSKTVLKKIVNELAAKLIISELNINFDMTRFSMKSYQELIAFYFFDKYYYEILPAGRYKINYKFGLSNRIFKKILAQDILDVNGKVIFSKNTYMDYEKITEFKKLSKEKKLDIFKTIKIDPLDSGSFKSVVEYEEIAIYIRGLNSPIIKIIGSCHQEDNVNITIGDFLAMISYVIYVKDKIGSFDDIDHLGNKRLKLVGELLETRVQLALSRINKYAIEKINNLEARINYFDVKSEESTDSFFNAFTILNTKPFQIVIKEFFNSHPLTQFLDQKNPLSELTNKRKISAMGPGGIKREDPNLNIRDVHYSHYGRICPIETPEGMNIGLIFALASYAKVDQYGFLNTPFYKVLNGKVTNEIHWLNAMEENNFMLVEATSLKDADNNLLSPVTARHCENVDSVDSKEINYIDVSCNQLVSISASLIPFLEHDDANRVLMGSNMQRQAVPLLKPNSPIVGTGIENRIVLDSEMSILAKFGGEVLSVDGNSLEIKYDNQAESEKISLIKFFRSNQNTCKNQNPLVKPKQKIKKGDLLVNGHAMQNGELALGQNLLVAFTTWYGYNFEDAIILSSKMYQEDIYTSLHIQEYTVECLRTKIGDEEITRNIPGVASDAKKYLDDEGLILVGAKVKEGDILVGKISPKANTDQTPEEKLLQAIFSEKARSVRDSSLRVPTSGEGIVLKITRFSIHKGDELNDDVIELVKVFIIQKRKIQAGDKMAGRHGNKGIVSKIVPIEDMPYLADGTPIDILLNPLGVPSRMNIGQVLESYLGLAARNLILKKMIELYFENNIEDASKIFGLPQMDIIRLFQIFKNYLELAEIQTKELAIAQLNKADLQIILSQAGFKYSDVDIKTLSPIFVGCKNDDLIEVLKKADLDPTYNNGKMELYDGKTGEKFVNNIAIGIIYMLKLDHMVDDKIYARSVGPYSKITQQPLGGKCQNGGQRFGEMEVWALEAYGAAYNLQELLTIKSDDIYARNSIYYCIIKGQQLPKPNIPESFKLLVKKLQAVGLKINVSYGNTSNLISCNEFIEQKLNRKNNLIYDNDYQLNLKEKLDFLNEKND